jgi:hypothetical protein
VPDEATGKTGVPTPTRLKPERPRDRLGRPLPWDRETELRLPNFDALSLEENDRLARAFVASGEWFGAHEAWETAWKQARGTGDEELFKGLSQMGAGYVHLLRGNAHGSVTLLRRASGRVERYPEGHLDLATSAIAAHLEAAARAIEDGTLVPGPDATFLPPPV